MRRRFSVFWAEVDRSSSLANSTCHSIVSLSVDFVVRHSSLSVEVELDSIRFVQWSQIEVADLPERMVTVRSRRDLLLLSRSFALDLLRFVQLFSSMFYLFTSRRDSSMITGREWWRDVSLPSSRIIPTSYIDTQMFCKKTIDLHYSSEL